MARDLEKYLRPEVKSTPFCAGCGHGILMNLILRSIDQLDISIQDMLFVSGIGCGAWIPSPNFKADTLHTLHGRAIAFAVGAKMFNPKLKTMVVSGDGDLTSIGGNHLIHAARRNIDLTVICANNMIYGMTGGQAASTSPLGIKSATTPKGNSYPPFDLVNLLRGAGAKYVARYAITQPIHLMKTIKQHIQTEGFTFLEVISPCHTQYGRRNQFKSTEQMLELLKNTCISREQAAELGEEVLASKIVTGEWNHGKS